MLRPSSRPSSRASYLPGGSGASSSSATALASASAKLLEKKKELEALTALERAATEFEERVKQLSTNADITAEGAETLCEVLGTWQNMFQLVGLLVEAHEDAKDKGNSEPPRLVRLGLDQIPIKQ